MNKTKYTDDKQDVYSVWNIANQYLLDIWKQIQNFNRLIEINKYEDAYRVLKNSVDDFSCYLPLDKNFNIEIYDEDLKIAEKKIFSVLKNSQDSENMKTYKKCLVEASDIMYKIKRRLLSAISSYRGFLPTTKHKDWVQEANNFN